MKIAPKHNNAKDALIEAGFSEKTATHQAKRVMDSALRYTAKQLSTKAGTKDLTSRQMMSELVGLSGSDVMGLLKNIAEQQKDLSSALKVLLPLAREHGVVLDSDEVKLTQPILNVVVEKNNGLLEPVIDAEVI